MTTKRSKNKKQTPRKRQQPKAQKAQPKPKRVGLRPAAQECVERYVIAKLNPFSPLAIGACNPRGDGGPTFKFSTRTIHTFTGIAGNNSLLMFSPTAANDTPNLQIANTFSPLTTDFDNMLIANVSQVNSVGSLLADASFVGGKMEQRMIGCGVRVYNTSPQLYKQGTLYGHTLVTGGLFAGNTNAADYNSYFNTRQVSGAGGKPIELHWILDTLDREAEWYANSEYQNQTGSYVGGVKHFSGFIALPSQGATQPHTWRVEMVSHWEVRGRTISSVGTTNPAAPNEQATAFSRIADILRSAGNDMPSSQQLVKIFYDGYKMQRILRDFTNPRVDPHVQHIEL